MMTQKIELLFSYNFEGLVNFSIVLVKEENEKVAVYNNFRERMFTGSMSEVIDFLAKLKQGEFA